MVTRSPRGFGDFPDASSMEFIRSQGPSGPSNYVNYPGLPHIGTIEPASYEEAHEALFQMSPKYREAAMHYHLGRTVQPDAFKNALHSAVLKGVALGGNLSVRSEQFLKAMLSRPTPRDVHNPQDHAIKASWLLAGGSDSPRQDEALYNWHTEWNYDQGGHTTEQRVAMLSGFERYHHALANDPGFADWDEDSEGMHVLGGQGKYGAVQKTKSIDEYEDQKRSK